MIIVNVSGGLGNQFFQYAAGLRLAKKWKTELKVRLDWYDKIKIGRGFYRYIKYANL